jgi:hypothetical protein
MDRRVGTEPLDLISTSLPIHLSSDPGRWDYYLLKYNDYHLFINSSYMRKMIMDEIHTKTCFGHPGYQKLITIERKKHF